MSATEEVQNVPVDVTQPEAPVAEKPVKEKKAKVPKEKKPKAPKTASHPPYFEMIKDALLALNEKGGSSPYAIAKFMEEKHKAVLPGNFRKILGLQLKNSAAKGKLIKIKASYKLSEANKIAPTKPAKKPAQTKKRAAPAKAKQPKSIKSPAAKKAKKAAAA
ncbi:hypothetical protein M9H77_05331 [Catharanthus roseus]|uniref:Uncharacterized protein n=1 Tax=Catharanthus roseus TaxID=4058 RepID=A0ACC0CH63_CATRO|nr:hypothetical protein M9H77_05331 [Catharanthus roseus]